MADMKAAAIASLCVVALTGCSHTNDVPDAPASSSSPAADVEFQEPDLRPVPDASEFDTVPSPLHATPSLARAQKAAEAGQTRLDGEQFALEVAHLVMDVRGDWDAEKAIDAVSSDGIDPQLKQFLIDDIDGQRAIGSGRSYGPGVDMWIRSRVEGSDAAPRKLDVEIAGVLLAKPFDLADWYRTRVDVVWQDERWQLVGYSSGGYGPESSANLTEAQQTAYLTGPGWRSIPAA
jgi:hypothetical protein